MKQSENFHRSVSKPGLVVGLVCVEAIMIALSNYGGVSFLTEVTHMQMMMMILL